LPVDIAIPERVMIDDEAMFVTLRTLDELELFWKEHKDQFKFACEGRSDDDPIFLREYEWVFGTSKSAVVKTVIRWNQSGIGCEFYNWAEINPEEHSKWFRERDTWREFLIEEGSWSADDENDYKADCIRRTPDTFRGWWQLKNLPGELDPSEWFDPYIAREILIDSNMPIAEVEQKLQQQTFDDWKLSDFDGVNCHDRTSIDETIAYWRKEQSDRQDYYGKEN
jgi:hypothetical protein